MTDLQTLEGLGGCNSLEDSTESLETVARTQQYPQRREERTAVFKYKVHGFLSDYYHSMHGSVDMNYFPSQMSADWAMNNSSMGGFGHYYGQPMALGAFECKMYDEATVASQPERPDPLIACGSNSLIYGSEMQAPKEEGVFRVAFRTKSEIDVLDDGFKWTKYGKKLMKNCPNPRNYYRCSNPECAVKKRVQRDEEDPSYVITTYEGVHNHSSPAIVYFTSKGKNGFAGPLVAGGNNF